MWAAMGRWLVLASCVMAAVLAAQDNVLRFLNHKETVRMAQQKHSDEMKVFASGFKRDLPMEKFRAQSTVCPNGITECPDTSTCCPLQDGQYGCCQGVNAVCCKDGVHCCPEGYKCDEQHGRCTSSVRGISFHWVDNKVLRAQPVASLAPNRTCPDNKTLCSTSDTCCRAVKGFGCCPLPNAVCCSDLVHCCPMGTKCDMVKKHCYRQEGDQRFPWIERRPEKESHSRELSEVPSQTLGKKRAVICKDGLMCPDGNTCCLLQNGSYGCCPYSDEKQSPAALSAPVVCPGGKYTCPSGNTCCRLASGQWGCCPHPNARCCPDHIHCCPHGYTCVSGQCQTSDGQNSLPWSVKTPAVPSVQSVICPDGSSECPDGSTCCKMSSGQYGCCPQPNAVCCSDGIHCCPEGSTCDLEHQTCKKGQEFIPWVEKVPSPKREEEVMVVKCPDGSVCADGSTCCLLLGGKYGCCPYSKAVCCKDKKHCCPEGYTCDVAVGTCNKNATAVPFLVQTAAVSNVQSVICPDGSSECPDGSTCCKMSSGQYGCCPQPNAVCCSDGIHCCPEGSTCDLEHQTCKKGQEFIPWVEKVPSPKRVQSVVCPGGQSECPDGNTCCKLTSGQYGCCPLPDAVCCSDGVHCCPQNTTCDLAKQTCDSGHYSIPWEKKLPARYSLP